MPRRTIRTLNRFGVIALALALSAGTAWAQQRHSPASPRAARGAHFSDQQLRSFAKSAIQLQRIGQKVLVTLRATKTPDAKQAVARRLEAQQVQAVKAMGLTVRQYNAISRAIRRDPQLRIKVDAYLKHYAPHSEIVAPAIPG